MILPTKKYTKRVLLDEENQVIIPFFEYNLEGIVADRKTGEMIPNATVTFASNGSDAEVLITDSLGAFISNLVKFKSFGYELDYTVTVSAEGYLLASFDLKNGSCYRFIDLFVVYAG